MPSVHDELGISDNTAKEPENVKKPLFAFLQLFEAPSEVQPQSFSEDVIKARAFAYHEKPNSHRCHTCTYMLIIASFLSLLLIAFFVYVICW